MTQQQAEAKARKNIVGSKKPKKKPSSYSQGAIEQAERSRNQGV